MAAAIPLIKAAIASALSPLVGVDREGLPRCYWTKEPVQGDALDAADPPTIIFQSQDNGGQGDPFVGSRGWTGLIAIKVYAPTDDAVDQMLPQIELAMAAITSPSGYSLSTIESFPLTLAADSGAAGGLIYRMALHQT
jgi:hypothetical protein